MSRASPQFQAGLLSRSLGATRQPHANMGEDRTMVTPVSEIRPSDLDFVLAHEGWRWDFVACAEPDWIITEVMFVLDSKGRWKAMLQLTTGQVFKTRV